MQSVASVRDYCTGLLPVQKLHGRLELSSEPESRPEQERRVARGKMFFAYTSTYLRRKKYYVGSKYLGM